MDDDKLIQITKAADGASLCLTCRWVHLQRGYRESEVAVFCNFSWPVRPVRFKVSDCTDYMNRTVLSRKEMEDIALIIPTPPKRKSAGCGGIGFALDFADEEEDLVSTME
jgi:hypothetical protein